MSYETILVEARAATRIIRLNRPERKNAVNHLMMRELLQALRAAGEDVQSRAVIIAGGDDCFSAGRDLKEASQSSPQERQAAKHAWRQVTAAIEGHPRPVVAAIEGHCLTGGLEFALVCDFRVAGDGASFGITSARLGTVPGFGGTQRLPRLVGTSRAMDLLFSAEPIGTDEALRIGLINRKAPRLGALEEALSMVEIYAERAPLSIAKMKRAVLDGIERPLQEALDLEQQLGASLMGTADRAEGVSAMLEKRQPIFRGR